LLKQVTVHGSIDDEEWRDNVETHIELTLRSDDEITYFPEFTIYANILINGGTSKDVVYKLEADVAFTNNDLKDDRKIGHCATKINRLVDDHIEQEFSKYINDNAEAIKWYKQSGDAQADDREDMDI
jgi:hypothetical protein